MLNTENNPLNNLDPWLQRLANVRFRLPVVVEGPREWAIACCQDWIQSNNKKHALWVSDIAPTGSWVLPLDKINHELGREADVIVFDGYAGFHVDALAAVAGTLKAGCCIFFIAPPLGQWATFDDPWQQRLRIESDIDWPPRQTFLQRAEQCLIQSGCVFRASQHGCIEPTEPLPSENDVLKATIQDTAGCLTSDQSHAYQMILNVASGHKQRPLVIQADRGRGKSSVLGLAIKQLAEQGKTVAVTAPRKESVDALFNKTGESTQETVRFYAPDYLLEYLPPADLLVIDEAAAIAPSLLQVMLANYSHVIMATTVDGYEGTGRGFDHRFKPFLNQQYPGWQQVIMQQPIRWGGGDWLESCIQTLLLLKPSGLKSPSALVENTDLHTLECKEFFYTSDSQSESTLNEIMELLISAHYRTRPSDLRVLMDGGNIRTFYLNHQQQVAAVVMIACEGVLPSALSKDILLGKRRPQGQVLPQTLAVHLGLNNALQYTHWRIIRIAVQPELQHQGLGSELLKRIQTLAHNENVDLLGSVFSGTPPLIQYWQRNGFDVVRVGYTAEATTGGYASVVVSGVSARGCLLHQQATQVFETVFPHQLLETHNHVPIDTVIKIVYPLSQTLLLEPWEQLWVHDYINGSKVYENVAHALWKAVWYSPVLHRLPLADAQIIVMKVLQKHPWPAVVKRLGLSGKREAHNSLKQAIAKLVNLSGLFH